MIIAKGSIFNDIMNDYAECVKSNEPRIHIYSYILILSCKFYHFSFSNWSNTLSLHSWSSISNRYKDNSLLVLEVVSVLYVCWEDVIRHPVAHRGKWRSRPYGVLTFALYPIKPDRCLTSKLLIPRGLIRVVLVEKQIVPQWTSGRAKSDN